MKAIILAAGCGSRLNKYTKNLPKCMLKINNTTLIEYQVNILKSCGIEDIIIVTGYKNNKINIRGVKYYNNIDYKNTNMVYSLMCAESEFNDNILVCYSDILYEKRLIECLKNSKDDYVVLCDYNWQNYWKLRYRNLNYDLESLVIDKNLNIIEIGKSNPKLEEIDARYIGLLKFSYNGIKFVSELLKKDFQNSNNGTWRSTNKNIKKIFMTDLLNELINEKKNVKAELVEHGWIEFDTNEDYENFFKWEKENILSQIIKIKVD